MSEFGKLMQTKNLLNIKIFTVLFFIIIFLLGLNLFKDYGIYTDDLFQRNNALFWYEYVKSFILEPGLSFTGNLDNLIKQNIKDEISLINTSTLPSLQPVALGIFCELFIDLFNIESNKSIYQTRHLFNFIIYLVGLCFFYKLINKRFKSYLFSFIGVLFLLLTPRFFAQSFYNSQDIFFLSLTIINMYTGINFLEKPNFKNTLTFSLSSGLAFDTRIMAVLSVTLILGFFSLKSLRSKEYFKSNLKYFFYSIFFTFFFIIVFWPYLWVNPISNFLFAVSELSTAAFLVINLYMGKFILSTNIPSHYHVIWIVITTPLIVITLFFYGSFLLLRRIFFRLSKLNENLNDLWRGNREMFDIYFLMMILLSILALMYRGLGYTGWRHLYFIYPSIIMISLYGFYYLHSIIKSNIIRAITYFLIIINLTYLAYWNYNFHPHQYAYFNLMFKKNFHKDFDMDYWGLSNKSAIEYIINNNDYPVTIGTKSFSSLEKSSLILKDEDRNKILITHNLNEADFIITNYMRRRNKDFVINKTKYKKYYEVLVDNKAINTVYKKIK
jgi:hypothetical protein|tara:strand:+ start:6964 stop:8628 length:1665 start_codon:yes stop_codon:yes gene_type:complete